MEKIKIRKTIFRDQKDKPFTWKDIKDIPFEDDDVIDISWVEPYYSENNSWDGHWSAEINRMVEETDEEHQKRIKDIEKDSKFMKERRYESYYKTQERV
jgi:hypothetical protein